MTESGSSLHHGRIAGPPADDLARPSGRRHPWRRLLGACLACGLLLGAGCFDADGPPYEPDEALETFRLPPGFRIELVASEPQITDPVDMSFDADGRLYVAEMADYPEAEGDSITSRIKLLEDRDGDGFFETGHLYAEDLPFVNGVMAWRQGVLVTRAPEILYLEDTDGDHRADVREVVLTGFAVTNPQLRMGSLEYGIDNWIYGAYPRASSGRRHPEHDDFGRALRFPGGPSGDSVAIFPGTDFRFRPAEFAVEPAGGMSQFGNSFDAGGNRFTIWNSKHLQHVVIPHRYARRNPWLSVGSVMASLPEHGDAATVYPITENPLNIHESEIGHFTSASGNSMYTGGLFEEPYATAAFVAEPVHNLVHVDLLTPAGPTFVARRARADEEFLASTDSWFRPVNTAVGPDGALYVADFYRKLIEHPAWIAHADSGGLYTFAGRLRKEDFLEGQDRGRIYRILPEGAPERPAERPTLSGAPAAELVDRLGSGNMWWRITAQRLLVERQDHSAVAPLRDLASRPGTPEAHTHALWTLEGLGALTEEEVLRALQSGSPLVRRHGVRLAERYLSSPGVRRRLVEMADDPDQRVQFQLALTLGELPEAEAFDAMKRIAVRNLEDPWFQTAVLTGAGEQPVRWFRSVLDHEPARASGEAKERFLRRIASVIGARQKTEEVETVLGWLRAAGEPGLQAAGLQGLGDGLGRGAGASLRLGPEAERDLLHLAEESTPQVQDAALDAAAQIDLRTSAALSAASDRAAPTATDEAAPLPRRVRAVRIIGLDPRPDAVRALEALLDPVQPTELRIAAAEALVRRHEPAATAALLAGWNSYPAAVRDVVERGLLGRTARVTALLEEIEAGRADAGRLSRTARGRLTGHSDPAIRRRARRAFASLQETPRDEVIRQYHEAIRLQGDAENGRAVFRRVCSTCHRSEGVGHEVGPDLASLSGRTRTELLSQTLKPNESIAPGYEAYVVETVDGRTFSGVLAEESAVSLVLRSPGGKEETILRTNLERAEPLTVSLMPEGLEGSMTIQEMADLLSYLKSLNESEP